MSTALPIEDFLNSETLSTFAFRRFQVVHTMQSNQDGALTLEPGIIGLAKVLRHNRPEFPVRKCPFTITSGDPSSQRQAEIQQYGMPNLALGDPEVFATSAHLQYDERDGNLRTRASLHLRLIIPDSLFSEIRNLIDDDRLGRITIDLDWQVVPGVGSRSQAIGYLSRLQATKHKKALI